MPVLRTLLRSGRNIINVLTGEASVIPVGTAAKPAVLYTFCNHKAIKQWHVFTDKNFGGKSTADFTLAPGGEAAVFRGHYSTEQDDDADMKRAGYCVAASKVMSYSDYFDIERHTHLIYTVKGDGHTYVANVRTDSLSGSGGDVWQAPFTPGTGDFSDIKIPFSSFVMTYKGQLVQHNFEMMRDKIISVGVAISARETTAQRDFSLEIKQIRAEDLSGEQTEQL
eukprot:jgi/Chrzof1/11034/Cz05g21060.t1